MALKFYDEVAGEPFSDSGLHTNPCIVSMDGRSGGTVEMKLFVGNDNIAWDYTAITVEPSQAGGSISFLDGSEGFSVKMKAGDAKPSAAEWVVISAATVISLVDILDDSTFLPFWVRFEFPPGIAVQHITNVSFKIEATESVSP